MLQQAASGTGEREFETDPRFEYSRENYMYISTPHSRQRMVRRCPLGCASVVAAPPVTLQRLIKSEE